jgi:hypothetical protein
VKLEPTDNSFAILAGVDVGSHIEKKNNLSYLSWAWAWDYLLREDPSATFEYGEPKAFGTVTAFGTPRTAHLPVMDHRNKAIPNPDAFAVNTAMQRALVKAIALHGLGLYIYAGEDLPAGEPTNDPEYTKFREQLNDAAMVGTAALTKVSRAGTQQHRDRVPDEIKKKLLETAREADSKVPA